jgi:hypothetical protein
MVIPILMALKRDNDPVPPLLHPIMVEFGLIDESQDSLPKDLEKSREVGGHKLDELPDLITAQQRLPDYEAAGPLIRVPPPPRGTTFWTMTKYQNSPRRWSKKRLTTSNQALLLRGVQQQRKLRMLF